jgi:iron complex outermembrane recepter protein
LKEYIKIVSLTIILSFILIINLQSQPWGGGGFGQPGGGGGRGGHGGFGGNPGDMQNQPKPKIGRITGTVIDAETSQPLQYAIVSVINPIDTTVVTGGLTSKTGEFKIKDIPVGKYIVRIKYIGYRSARTDSLLVTPNRPGKDFGIIKLHQDAVMAKEVIVTAQKDAILNSIDKKTINVDETILTVSQSATDVLQQVPSVSVDINNNITLRGSGNVTVLVDGRQSAMTGPSRSAVLDQIPASSIDKIEIITNPSAKYDAEGMSGIINIITKKTRDFGANATTNISAGSRNKYNGNANGNIRYGDFNLYSNFGYRYDFRANTGTDSRKNTFNDTTSFLFQGINGTSINRYINAMGGLDYLMNDDNTLGWSVSYNKPIRTGNQLTNLTNRSSIGNILQNNDRNQFQSSGGYYLESSLNYKLTLAPKHELTTSATFSYEKETDDENFKQIFYTPVEPTIQQQQNSLINNKLIVLQADYSLPFKDVGSFETGFKSTLRRLDNDYLFGNYISQALIKDTNTSNHFLYNEDVYALYATYQGLIGLFGYKIGARYEYTATISDQVTAKKRYNRNYGDLFPSAYLTYKPSFEDQIQLNYSRRINRPDMEDLNPFTDYSDPQNLRTGNPFLKPEYTNALELGYTREMSWMTVTSTVYYRRTNDLNTRIKTTLDSIRTITTYENINNRTNIGLEIVDKFDILSWWNAMITLNLFNSSVSGNLSNQAYANQNKSWMLQFMSTMNIPDICQFQLSGNYNGPRTTPQGSFKGMYGVNLGFKRELFDKASLTFNVSDLFNTRRFAYDLSSYDASGNGFAENLYRKRDSQVFTLTFTYKFGGLLGDEQRQLRRASDFVPTEKFDNF